MSINIASEIVHFAGHTACPPPPCRRYDLPGAACLVSSVDRCSVSSVRACASVRGVVCLASGTACPAACSVQSIRVRWSGRGAPAGYTTTAQPRPVSLSTTEKIKKAQKTPHPLLSISKISRKNKKTPTKGLYSVLYLPYKP